MKVKKKTTLELLDDKAFETAVNSAPQGRQYMYLPTDFQACTYISFMGTKQEALIPSDAAYAYRVDRDADGIEVTRIKPNYEVGGYLVPFQLKGRIAESSPQKDNPYPHKCPQCGGPAYIGAFKVDCLAKCH